MEASESGDLESLLDLIDEKESTSSSTNNISKQKNGQEIEKELSDADLDSFIGLLDEEDCKYDIYTVGSNKKQKRVIKLSDSVLFSATDNRMEECSASNIGETSLVHTGDTSDEEDQKEDLTEIGRAIKEKIKTIPDYKEKQLKLEKHKTWKSQAPGVQPVLKKETHSLDKLTGINIVNPLVAFDVMEKRLNKRKLIKMSFIKSYRSKGGNIEGDWVTIGVLVNKTPPKTSKTGKVFSIWKLTDLHNTDKLVSLFLFGKVHSEHWKTAIGTVIGILNPTFLDSKEGTDYLDITVDHPGKIMLIGTSKDFGHCKSKKKDGFQCKNIVNLSQCQFCAYHVKNEYKKFSPRMDIQSSWSGSGSSFKNKVLKGQNFFYAGQSFAPLGKPEKKSNNLIKKDKLTLSNLTLKRKAATVFNEEKEKSESVNKIAEVYGKEVSKTAEKNSEFINNRLLIPSAGSRNILQLMMKKKAAEEKQISVINPRELLKQHAFQMKSQMGKKDDSTILKNLRPELGRGLSPGQSLTFNIQSCKSSNQNFKEYAKITAIQKIRESGPIKRKNPNSVKSNPEPKKIKAALEVSLDENSVDGKTEEKGTRG